MCCSVGSQVIRVLRLRTAPATNPMAFIGMEMPSTFSVALGYCSLQSTAWSRGQMLHFGMQLDFFSYSFLLPLNYSLLSNNV